MTMTVPVPHKHFGRRIQSIRRLRGISERELGETLGMSVQDVTILEQRESVTEDMIKKVASALGVTEQGLIEFDNERIQYNTINFYENCGVNVNTVANNCHQSGADAHYRSITEALELILKKLNAKCSQCD